MPTNEPFHFDSFGRLGRWLPDALTLRQFTGLTLANVVVACTSLVTLVVLARTLAVDEFAQLIFARSAVGIAFTLVDPRVEDALVRFLPGVERDHGGAAASRLFERMLRVDQGVNIAFGTFGVTLLLVAPVPQPSIADPTLLSLSTMQMAAQGAIGTMSAGFALTNGLARWGLLQSLSMIAFTAASLGGLVVGGPVGFLAAGAISAVLTTSVLWFTTLRATRRAYGPPARERYPLPRGFASFTLRAAANSSVSIGAEALPLTVIGLRASAFTLAGFRIALSPGRLASAVVSPVASIMYPRASRASAAGQPAHVAEEALRFTRRAAPIAAVFLCVAALAMPTLITFVFGESYSSFSTTATILLGAALVRGTVAWSKTLPLAFGDATRRLAVSVLDAVALVAAAALLAETPQAQGVAVAYVAIALAVSLYWLVYAHRKHMF